MTVLHEVIDPTIAAAKPEVASFPDISQPFREAPSVSESSSLQMKFTEARRHREQMTAANEAGLIRNTICFASSVAPTFFHEDAKIRLSCGLSAPRMNSLCPEGITRMGKMELLYIPVELQDGRGQERGPTISNYYSQLECGRFDPVRSSLNISRLISIFPLG
jgi:hypothetical protein